MTASVIRLNALRQIDPTRAAVAPRPLCAASLQLGERHRVGADPDGYRVVFRGHIWHFCSARCLTRWASAALSAAP